MNPIDTPPLAVRSPADLVAAVPYLLGFHPVDSVVVVAMRGRRITFAARLDLPDPADPSASARHLAAVVARQDTETATVVGYGPATRVTPGVDAVRVALADEGITVLDALRVTDDRYWSYLCAEAECCPPVQPHDVSVSEVTRRRSSPGCQPCPRAALAAQSPGRGPERRHDRGDAQGQLRLTSARRAPDEAPASQRGSCRRLGRPASRPAPAAARRSARRRRGGMVGAAADISSGPGSRLGTHRRPRRRHRALGRHHPARGAGVGRRARFAAGLRRWRRGRGLGGGTERTSPCTRTTRWPCSWTSCCATVCRRSNWTVGRHLVPRGRFGDGDSDVEAAGGPVDRGACPSAEGCTGGSCHRPSRPGRRGRMIGRWSQTWRVRRERRSAAAPRRPGIGRQHQHRHPLHSDLAASRPWPGQCPSDPQLPRHDRRLLLLVGLALYWGGSRLGDALDGALDNRPVFWAQLVLGVGCSR